MRKVLADVHMLAEIELILGSYFSSLSCIDAILQLIRRHHESNTDLVATVTEAEA